MKNSKDNKKEVNNIDKVINQNRDIYDIFDELDYSKNIDKGLNEEIIKEISKIKNEPKWLLDFRLKAYSIFKDSKDPKWGPDLSKIDINNLLIYIKPDVNLEKKWDKLPEYIFDTFNRLRNS